MISAYYSKHHKQTMMLLWHFCINSDTELSDEELCRENGIDPASLAHYMVEVRHMLTQGHIERIPDWGYVYTLN